MRKNGKLELKNFMDFVALRKTVEDYNKLVEESTGMKDFLKISIVEDGKYRLVRNLEDCDLVADITWDEGYESAEDGVALKMTVYIPKN